ncbi:ABC transporter ATP-binding protein [Chloracidobacterium validum]|uniref:ABC transporter ATP-binding protein n=1 Tax=Chloracidobacterium validum TaxID=2821543 RepID=A0ABX8BBG5_9BACT|nr:ABC transporter ATP-binding protein [Chloracidobacterium validum]
MLVVNQLTYRYPGTTPGQPPLVVFERLCWSVDAGTSTAIVGASGVGKSTLLHVLGGLDAPTSGEVRVMGASLWAMSATARARFRNQTIGFVFQFHHLLPEFTALENVALPMRMAGVSAAESHRRAEALLERVGLGNRRHHLPTELSGGESQRVALARALANTPPLLLADEPTGNLDERTAAEVLKLLHELQQDHHMTLVIVTHDTNLAATCQQVWRLEHGQLTRTGP